MRLDTIFTMRTNLLRCLAIVMAFAVTRPALAVTAPVSLTENPDSFILSNGILTAKVQKRSGSLASLVFKDLEMLHPDARHASGYWSHTASAPRMIVSVSIDPKSNSGERAEVSIKGISGGARLGNGPGGSTVADIEIRYALARGQSGIYTYALLEHPADYPATSIGEARFCAKLNDELFDWMTVDAQRNKLAITAADWNQGEQMNMKEARRMTTGVYKGQVEHKYDYTANQFDTRAFGWSSTERHVGVWFINASTEYLSGGPTKVEFCCHRDATFGNDPATPAPPCILNYWRSSHYGGSSLTLANNEAWSKVVGPFMIYCNAGPTPGAMWKDALAAATTESEAWPYDWVKSGNYPHKEERGGASGQLVLTDPQAPQVHMTNIRIGLTPADYTAGGGRGGPTTISWQMDAKGYQFWTRADDAGHFKIENVRPGRYTLHAIADGVLGEYSQTGVEILPGKPLDLGRLAWTPIRYGRQIWEIGTADRTAGEFLHGDHYWQWGLYNEYPKDFPSDVNFIIGKSDPAKDWNYCQCPRADRPNGTPWTITFDLPNTVKGKAILRLAFAATSAKRVSLTVNGAAAGDSGPLQDTASIRRDGITGYWYERDITFDAELLKQGKNVLTLTIPPGGVMSGIEYDYLRLEWADESKK